VALDSVGYYALPVIPSFEGMDRQINSQMRGAFGDLGRTAGRDMGRQVGQGLRQSAGQVQAAARQHRAALDTVADATGKLRAEEAKLQASRSNAGAKASAVGTAERRLNELRATGTATDRQLATAERAVQTAREQARNAAAQSTTVEERVNASRRREAAAAREARTAETELANARRAAAGAGSGGGDPFSGARRGMSSSEGGLASLAGGIGGKVGKAFMGALGGVVSVAAVGMLFKSAIDTGIDFEKTVNAFSGVTNSGAAGMEKMRVAARALGTDTQLAGVSASDAGKAMLELAKGGFTADQAMAAARGTLQLATAGQLDAAEAAKYQSAAINMFQLNAGDAAHVADLLAASANASSADVSDLGIALQQGGSVAAGFGVSIEDTLTALTLFSKWGINGSDAGTMLKTSLQAITDQGNPAQGAIHDLGLELYDAQGKFVGVESMMKQVGDASKRMTQEQFQASTAVLFGSDAMRASMVAANGGADAWNATAEAVNRQGAAADMAGAQMQGLPGVVEAMSNAWEGFKLKLFDVLDGPLIAIGKWFLDLINSPAPDFLTKYADNFRGLFSGISEGIGPVKDAISGLGDAFRQYVLPALSEYADKLKGPLGDLGRQLGATFKEAAPTLKMVATIIGGALLGALKGLGVVMPIIIGAWTNVMRVAQLFHQGLQGLAGVLSTVGGVIGGVFTGAWSLLQTAISAAWAVISPVWEGIKAGLSALGEAGRYVFDTVLLPMWHNLQLAGTTAWAALQPVFGFLGSAWDAVASAATAFWQGAVVPVWEGVKEAFSAGWGAISPIFDMLKNAFKGVSDFVSGVWSGLAGTVKSALDAVIGAVKGPLHWLGGVLQRVPMSIGPVEIPGAQVARDLGNTLAGLAGGGVAGRTRAGRLFGPGTATSDSILGVDARGYPTALVSTGEGVVKTAAMRAGGDKIVAALNSYRGGGTVQGPDVEAAMSLAGTGYSQGNRTDCSGMVARVILKALGMDDSGGLMTTKNAAQWLTEHGFQTGTGGRGAVTVGWYDRGPAPNDGHMAMTLSDGENAEAGGSNGVFTVGANATGGDDPKFDHHMFLPIEGLYGEGSGGGGGGGFGGGLSGAGTGATPKQIREATDKVSDREADVTAKQALVNERQAKLDAAKPEQKDTAQRLLDTAKVQLDKATRERDEAKADLGELKSSAGKGGAGGAGGGAGGGDEGGIAGILKSFVSDTFGLGDLFPDPSQLGIVKLFQAVAGIKYNPQGKGFPWETGYANGDGTPGSGSPTDMLGDMLGLGGGGGGDLPLGMIPGVSSMLPEGLGGGAAHGGANGGLPGPVDASTNITIQNPQMDERSNANLIRRTVMKTPRYGTYGGNPVVMS
jgi:TP901 family phage tail tape measure protein